VKAKESPIRATMSARDEARPAPIPAKQHVRQAAVQAASSNMFLSDISFLITHRKIGLVWTRLQTLDEMFFGNAAIQASGRAAGWDTAIGYHANRRAPLPVRRLPRTADHLIGLRIVRHEICPGDDAAARHGFNEGEHLRRPCLAPSPSSAQMTDGRCIVRLAFDGNGPQALAVDATSVYWTTSGESTVGGTIVKAPLAGGSPTTLATSQVDNVFIAQDSTSIYWTNHGTSQSKYTDGMVMKVSKSGGTPVTLASNQAGPWGIAVDANSVYWANVFDNTVMKVPLGGGTPTMLASGQATPSNIVVDKTSVYWTNNSAGGSVMKVPLGGGTPTTLASNLNYPLGITVDATSVYWTNHSDGRIMKVPLGGGISTILFSGTTSDGPKGIAVDTTSVYWTSGNARTITKVPLAGGSPTTLYSDPSSTPSSIAVDASSVYWTDGNVLTVTKLSPK